MKKWGLCAKKIEYGEKNAIFYTISTVTHKLSTHMKMATIPTFPKVKFLK